MPSEPWEEWEHEAQRVLGLRSTVASGNQWNDPGDGVTAGHYSECENRFIIDCKYTESKSYSLTVKELLDWDKRSKELGLEFVLPLRFRTEGGGTISYAVSRFSFFADVVREDRPKKVESQETDEDTSEVDDAVDTLYRFARRVRPEDGRNSLVQAIEILEGKLKGK